MTEVLLRVGNEEPTTTDCGDYKISKSPNGIIVECRAYQSSLSAISLYQQHTVHLYTKKGCETCMSKTLLHVHNPRSAYVGSPLRLAYRLASLLADGALSGDHAYKAAYDVFWRLWSGDEGTHEAIAEAIPEWAALQSKTFHHTSHAMTNVIIPIDWSRGSELQFTSEDASLIHHYYGGYCYQPKKDVLEHAKSVLEECLKEVEKQLTSLPG